MDARAVRGPIGGDQLPRLKASVPQTQDVAPKAETNGFPARVIMVPSAGSPGAEPLQLRPIDLGDVEAHEASGGLGDAEHITGREHDFFPQGRLRQIRSIELEKVSLASIIDKVWGLAGPSCARILAKAAEA